MFNHRAISELAQYCGFKNYWGRAPYIFSFTYTTCWLTDFRQCSVLRGKKKMSVALSWGHLSYFLFYRTHEHQKACYYSVQKWEQNHLLIPWCLQYITAASNLSWDIRARRCHIERAEIMKISANQISFDRIFCKIHYSTSKGQNFMISGVPQCCRKYLNTLINVHTIKINSI